MWTSSRKKSTKRSSRTQMVSREIFFKKYGLTYLEKPQLVLLPCGSAKFTEQGIEWGGIEWEVHDEEEKRKLIIQIFEDFGTSED